jgi:Bacterial alpha-L-rhamnosidase 6 hairpin glycosidase domain
MERREFAKDIFLASLAMTVSPLLNGQINNTGISPYLKIVMNDTSPQFDFFSIDSLGKNKLAENVILHDEEWEKNKHTIKKINKKINYFNSSSAQSNKAVWDINISEKSFAVTGNYQSQYNQPFLFNIEQHANHATLLGIMDGDDNKINLPAVLHLPDMGTLRVTCNTKGIKVNCTAQRFIEHPFVRLEFPAADEKNKRIIYTFEVVSIHPAVNGIENDSRYDCFRKNFISIFQLSPLLKILANNTSSDACAFTLFKYATVAAHTPALINDLHANDLIRMTLDRYLAGKKGYGMLGYDYDKEWEIPESATSCPSLDSYPSLLMSACIYTLSSKDEKWFSTNYTGIKKWADKMLSMDKDNDGLLEFCLSGNSGSWKGDKSQRPANWWDTIGFGHKDAYSNALVYNALVQLEKSIRKYGAAAEADYYKAKAAQLKSIYTATFFNPATGILAGWKSADGKLHDYYFIFVNTVAISYGLIENELANSIMDRLLQKMKDVGYTNFELGLPGNLIPVIRADYTDLLLEVGGGKREDNLDGFQIYENGGATACYTYFTIHALQKLGRKKDADEILLPLLKSMSDGNFQGKGANGRTKDWKTWSGECWGYEGFLVDNYMFLLAVLEREKIAKDA